MGFEKICRKFKSTNGTDTIACYVYKPASEPKCAVQIVHGMCEHIGRYEEFAGFLCANGILVFGHDQLGHGHSAKDREHLGYFAPERGWQYLAKDAVRMTRLMHREYPELPVFILGHSMGSLVTRAVLAKHSDLYSGTIFLGTLNTVIGANAGMAAAKALLGAKGERARSKLFDDFFFGMNNIKIDDPVNRYAWLSRDDEVCTAFEKDLLCSFGFTAKAYSDLLMLLDYVSRRDWAEKVDNDLPVLIASGSEDPVGNYGKAPEEVFRRLEASGQRDIELKLYSGARHEVLHETNRAEVFEDLLAWIDEHTGTPAE